MKDATMLASQERTLFVAETRELLELLEQGLLRLEAGPDLDAIHGLFRAAHTIKGNAGIIGASACARFTHVMESVLSRLRDGKIQADGPRIALLLQSVDVLREATDAIAEGEANPPFDRHERLFAALGELAGEADEEIEAPDTTRTFQITIAIPADEPLATLGDLVDEIAATGEMLEVDPPRDTPGVRELRVRLRASVRTADIEAIAMFANATLAIEVLAAPEAAAVRVETATEGRTPPPAAAAPRRPVAKGSSPVRVDANRLDRLLDLVGEMANALGALHEAIANRSSPHAVRMEALEVAHRLGTEVQESVMALRMVAVRDTLERMRRPAHDAAQQLGKQVVLEVEGSETELDRKLLDDLADPLTHMVRNAVAHGIEDPAVREARGKPAIGRLCLRAMHRDGAAVVEVEDDGAGIDTEKVLKRAIERGLVEKGAQLNEDQVHALLFAPGFSTAESVNQIAGRGVGLDVVVKNVERLRGRVEIRSQVGVGTVFRIRLPLTVAVLEGMNVRVGRETLSIPLREVEELLDPAATEIRTLEGKAEYVDVRGNLVPLVRLGDVLGLTGARAEGRRDANVVVVRSERRRFGVAVDDVLGIARNVVKSLDRSFALCSRADRSFERPAGVGGATILDNGSVGYVLDVHGLDEMAFG